jgi:predicted nuclease with RNAse H fold
VQFIGVDVSATRGIDVAVLREDRVASLHWFPSHREFGGWISSLTSLCYVGIDAPSSRPIRTTRRCESYLLQHGVSVHPTPGLEEPLPEWMKVGGEVWEATRAAGFVEARALGSGPPAAIEVYPYLAYVCFSGALRPRHEVDTAWARRQVGTLGIKLPQWAEKDQADAVCAALVARAYADGSAVPYGEPSEGVIWSPFALPKLRPGAAAGPAARGSLTCGCGCGGATSGRRGVRFLPGHDAKLAARLSRET